MSVKKSRLDLLLVKNGLADSRQRARAKIVSGDVLVDGLPRNKPSSLVSPDAVIEIKGADLPYVSRGGLKLEAGLRETGMDVTGRVCLDVGASTGGFTDCLLQHGAARVFAVDVGYGQLAWSLRTDPRVTVIERTNIRHMPREALDTAVDLVTIDTAFISLKIVVPAVLKFMQPDAAILALIKPQFEVGKGQVGKGGVVRDPALHDQVVTELTDFFKNSGLVTRAVIPSPIRGPKGNLEFIAYLKGS
jgi:23S rRNA (cytidine1920-2'-O)/16S rRNA (cytidine1409-2'-O)-methyltransferase